MSKQSGFTLIELIMVIVILGVLSAVALPKFVDLKSDARQAALNGVAGSLSTASAINFASRSLNPLKGLAISSCPAAANLLQGGLPGDYNIPMANIGSGLTVSCTLNTISTPVLTTTFPVTGIS